MTEVERIAPPVPTLPSPVGRSVGGKRRGPDDRRERRRRGDDPPPDPPDRTPSDHIDEYA